MIDQSVIDDWKSSARQEAKEEISNMTMISNDAKFSVTENGQIVLDGITTGKGRVITLNEFINS